MNYLPRSIEEYFKQSYVSLIIVSIMVITFLQITQSGATNIEIVQSHNAFQAKAVINGEYFRLIGWIFVHLTIVELGFSVLALLIIGANLERLIGSVRFALFYLIAGIVNGLILVYLHANVEPNTLYYYGAAPSVAASITALIFIRFRRPRWFDDTDLRVLWVFMTAYIIIIFSGFALGLNATLGWIIYITGFVLGIVLSLGLVPENRFDG